MNLRNIFCVGVVTIGSVFSSLQSVLATDVLSARALLLALNDIEVETLIEQTRQRFTLTPDQEVKLRQFANGSELLDTIRRKGIAAGLLTSEEKEAIISGIQQIANISSPQRYRDKLSLVDVMRPLFSHARERVASGKSAIDESRAAFLALSIYMEDVDLVTMFGEEGRGIASYAIDRDNVQLARRRDLARHFAASAGLAVTVGPEEADRIGLSKEMDDMRKSSGFSFSDLAADRAGIKLAVAATASEPEARRIIHGLAALDHESAIMPSVLGLADGLNEKKFVNYYQQVGSDRFDRVIVAISEKINALSIYTVTGDELVHQ